MGGVVVAVVAVVVSMDGSGTVVLSAVGVCVGSGVGTMVFVPVVLALAGCVVVGTVVAALVDGVRWVVATVVVVGFTVVGGVVTAPGLVAVDCVSLGTGVTTTGKDGVAYATLEPVSALVVPGSVVPP